MAAILRTSTQNYIGTAADRAALATGSIKAGSTFVEYDTQTDYIFDGSVWRAT